MTRLALLVTLLVALTAACDPGPAGRVTPAVSAAPLPAPACAAPDRTAPDRTAPDRAAPDRTTPSRVVAALAEALARRDLCALARLRGDAPDPAGRLRAERAFFGAAGVDAGSEVLWGRALGALSREDLAGADARAAAGAERVELRAELGGGALWLVLVRGPEGWSLR